MVYTLLLVGIAFMVTAAIVMTTTCFVTHNALTTTQFLLGYQTSALLATTTWFLVKGKHQNTPFKNECLIMLFALAIGSTCAILSDRPLPVVSMSIVTALTTVLAAIVFGSVSLVYTGDKKLKTQLIVSSAVLAVLGLPLLILSLEMYRHTPRF
jgi:hypothetical protein